MVSCPLTQPELLIYSTSIIGQVKLKLPVLIFPYLLSLFPSSACRYCFPLWTRSHYWIDYTCQPAGPER